MEEKRVKPIVLTSETGKKYTLEFNRRSVEYAENHGFDVSAISGAKIMSGVTELFFYSFRMHHPNMTKEQTDKILFDDLGGLSTEIVGRLAELYTLPYSALFNEDARKNAKMTVQM